MKNKTTAGILAIFLGGIGIHRFYLGQGGIGLVYLLFCWTFVPAAIAFIDAIIFFTTDQKSFDEKYNRMDMQIAQMKSQMSSQQAHANPGPDWAEQMEKLHSLKEKGIITPEEFEERKRRIS